MVKQNEVARAIYDNFGPGERYYGISQMRCSTVLTA
jgi:hypothetical protein